MYEVFPDANGNWILYKFKNKDRGKEEDFDIIATFYKREDAEFAKTAFENRG